jgi:hypothetical protein
VVAWPRAPGAASSYRMLEVKALVRHADGDLSDAGARVTVAVE